MDTGMDQEYDVIVIGAGFGGPVAAKKCADAGLKTLMLERSENVGEKVISGLTIPVYGFLFGPAFIRDGNPPIERPVDGIRNHVVYDIETGDIDIVEVRIPRPVSPVFAFGYNAYCKPFCEWECDRAVESGAELRTSTTVVEFIRENGRIAGVVTDRGERIACRIVINCEGSQGLLAVKAGVREKYPPEAISLADTYDYEMARRTWTGSSATLSASAGDSTSSASPRPSATATVSGSGPTGAASTGCRTSASAWMTGARPA